MFVCFCTFSLHLLYLVLFQPTVLLTLFLAAQFSSLHHSCIEQIKPKPPSVARTFLAEAQSAQFNERGESPDGGAFSTNLPENHTSKNDQKNTQLRNKKKRSQKTRSPRRQEKLINLACAVTTAIKENVPTFQPLQSNKQTNVGPSSLEPPPFSETKKPKDQEKQRRIRLHWSRCRPDGVVAVLPASESAEPRYASSSSVAGSGPSGSGGN